MEPPVTNSVIVPSSEISRPFSIRLTADQRRALDLAASAEGVGPSTLARCAVVAAAGRPLPPIAARRDALAVNVARGVGELGRLGNLLNQLARVANSRRTLASEAATAAFESAVRELAAVRTALIEVEQAGGRNG
jgi:hypothetical protein